MGGNSSRIATKATRREPEQWAKKWGTAVPLSVEGKLGPHLTQCGLGRGLLRTKPYPDPSSCFAVMDMGRKVGSHIFNHQKILERPQLPNDKC